MILVLIPLSLQVTATDGDKDRPENIVYFLTGQGIDTDRPDQSKFDINKTTGEIFVLKVMVLGSFQLSSPPHHYLSRMWGMSFLELCTVYCILCTGLSPIS